MSDKSGLDFGHFTNITPLYCPICNTPATLKCSGCKNVVYCGKDHQKDHWRKGHKQQCKCYEVASNENLGRYLRSTRDIKKGEVILREIPILIGPKVASLPICLGCHKKLPQPESIKKDYYRCSKCTWPLCGVQCENSKHHVEECNVMADRKFICSLRYDGTLKKEAAYCVIAPLRILLMKKNNPEQYKRILELQSHLEQRINTPLYNVLKANLVIFVKTILAIKELDENEILTAAAILDTNAFEVRLSGKDTKIRGLYPQAAMISHNCVPNTRHIFDNNMQLILVATTIIPKGSIISATYTQPLKGTLQRREHLKLSKCFECTCDRCNDPSEFDTYVGSISCSKCKIGKILSLEPLDHESVWKCHLCPHQITGKLIASGNRTIEKEIDSIEKTSIRDFEEFLYRYRDILHEKNTHVLQVKYALTQLYGNVSGFYLTEMNNAAIKRKIDLCKELLELADIFEPGWSRFRGMLLLDLQEVMVVQIKRAFEDQAIDKDDAQEQLMECLGMLQEAVQILSIEPGMKEALETRLQTLEDEIDMQ